ncbi:MAG: hypothetical protein MMC33_005213 [Icmadophila ericetorum]|nr:hypothetical protein [Icmadophila ericetorum]
MESYSSERYFELLRETPTPKASIESYNGNSLRQPYVSWDQETVKHTPRPNASVGPLLPAYSPNLDMLPGLFTLYNIDPNAPLEIQSTEVLEARYRETVELMQETKQKLDEEEERLWIEREGEYRYDQMYEGEEDDDNDDETEMQDPEEEDEEKNREWFGASCKRAQIWLEDQCNYDDGDYDLHAVRYGHIAQEYEHLLLWIDDLRTSIFGCGNPFWGQADKNGQHGMKEYFWSSEVRKSVLEEISQLWAEFECLLNESEEAGFVVEVDEERRMAKSYILELWRFVRY